jgi:UDP-N-acetylglucosamine--N-acetylmuramyl-(pentapeptide) pyrophosphoryl-undecaprenol N-acetylglucosamine transferase
MTLRLIVAAGGTGGHFYPGVAVLEALRERGPVEALFVGTERGIEAKKVPAMGEQLATFDVAPLNGVRGIAKLRALFKLPGAGLRAWRTVAQFSPHALLSVGGYASGPATMVAIAQGIPTVVVEPNAVPGFTNRVVGRRVSRACVAWEETSRYFRDGSVRVTGTPVRRAFLARAALAQDTRGEVPTVLVVGGSQGARALNEHVPGAIARLVSQGERVRVIHQSGVAAQQSVTDAYRAAGLADSVEVTAFIDDVASAMASADLVVCRSGAGTVSELCVIGRPAIYVPLPTAADDHQRKNAEAVVARGAGECLLQSDLTTESLASRIGALLSDRAALRAMGERAKQAGFPRASDLVADEVLAVAKGHSPGF